MSFCLSIDEQLQLRLVEPRYADEIYAAVDADRGHIGRWMSWVGKTRSSADTRRWAEGVVRGFAERRVLAVSILEEGRLVGGSGWTDWQTHDPERSGLSGASADIGYWLVEDAQGRGIATRVTRALVDHAFLDHGMNRLTIRAEPDNTRSWRVAERLGFRHEGTLRHVCEWDGRWVDHKLYAVLAEEWRGMNGGAS